MRKLSFITFLSTLVFWGCGKNDPSEQDILITVYSPVQGAVFHSGDTVFMKATIESPSVLHGWKTEIIRKSDDTVIFTVNKHSHAKVYDIDEFWVNDVSAHSNLKVVFTAEIDHLDNRKTAEVSIHCHP